MRTLKRFFIFSSLIVSFFPTINKIHAQEVAFGIKAGANLANVIDLPGDSPDMLLGAHIGPFIKLPIGENFSIIPELLFSMKGYKVDDNAVSLSYIDIPIMANYQLESGLNFELGPYVGFLLAADAEGTDVKEGMESVDFGVGVGLGYRLDNGLGFGARYSIGLATITKETDLSEASGKNSVIGISVSWLFGQD